MQRAVASTTAKSTATTQQVTALNLNHASQKQLQQLPGIGKKKAESIIAYRQKHNGFKSLNELESIRGINSRALQKLKPHLKLQ